MKLSDEDVDAVADRVVEKMTDHFHKEGGKFFFGWVAKILFGAAIALAAWQVGSNSK